MPIFIGSCSCPKSLQLFGNMPSGFGFWLRLKSNILCAFCFSPAWWLWRSVYTRSHLELGRKSLQRQWYFVLRRGRVGRCQACERQKQKPFIMKFCTKPADQKWQRVLWFLGTLDFIQVLIYT